ncbi:sodium-dependent transporter [Acidobacteriota bacterium]
MKERESWTTRVGFILATLGFSAGIGNLWRFPYLTGKYGGGIFLLFYMIIVVLLAIPLFTVEITLGKVTRKDPVGAYKTLKPKSPWFLNGYLNVATMLLIAGYAAPIVGSIFAYIFKTAVGTFSGRTSQEIADYYASFSSNGLEVVIWTLLATAILVIILRRGLNKGVEAANNIMMPALFIIIIILIVRALTLPGVSKGLTFYLKPDIAKFTWEGALAAIGQAFFAIGVAMCVALVYGSYLPKESKKVVSNSAIVVLSSTVIAFMAGLIIFPSVFSFGLDPSSGIGLTFITMPNVFNKMPAGTVFGTLFYILFFLAALTSFIGAFEGIGAFLRDNFNFSRNKSVLTVGIGVMILATLSASSQKFFGIADFLSNNIFLILGALGMAVFVGWVWKMPQFAKAAGIESKRALFIWTVLVKYIAPIVILVTWLAQLGVIEKIGKLF